MEAKIAMTYEIIIGLLGFVAAMAVVVRPLIALNSNITALTVSVNQLKDILEELKGRVTKHGDEIDLLQKDIADHEARIKILEKEK